MPRSDVTRARVAVAIQCVDDLRDPMFVARFPGDLDDGRCANPSILPNYFGGAGVGYKFYITRSCQIFALSASTARLHSMPVDDEVPHAGRGTYMARRQTPVLSASCRGGRFTKLRRLRLTAGRHDGIRTEGSDHPLLRICMSDRVETTSRAVELAGVFPARAGRFGAADEPPDNGQTAGESMRAGAEHAAIEGRFKMQDQLHLFAPTTAVAPFPLGWRIRHRLRIGGRSL